MPILLLSLRVRILALMLLLSHWLGVEAWAQTINEALDNTSLTFTQTGTWTGSLTGGLDGQDRIYGGDASGASELTTTVTGPGWLVYWKWKSSYEGASSVLLDGAVQESWPVYSYDQMWLQRSIPLSAGNHEIRWIAGARSFFYLDHVSVLTPLDLSVTLAELLPGFTWTTGGTLPWTDVLYTASRLNGQVMSSMPYSATVSGQSWMETTVTGPGKVTWEGDRNYVARLSVYVDGKLQAVHSRNSHYSTVAGTLMIPPGNHTVRWQNEREPNSGNESNASEATLSRVNFTPGTVRTFAEALGAPNLTFTTGGASPWAAQLIPLPPQYPSTLSDFAHAGILAPGEESWLETTIVGPGLFVSSGYQYTTQYNPTEHSIIMDGVAQTTNPTFNVTMDIGLGSHTVRWRVLRSMALDGDGNQGARVLNTVDWKPMDELSFSDALENTEITFSSPSPSTDVYGRDAANNTGQDGVYFQNGGMLRGHITGPGILSWTTTGAASSSAYFTYFLDGLAVATYNSIAIPPGQHEFKWAQSTAPSWLLDVKFVPATVIPLPTALNSGGGLIWRASPEMSAFSSEDGIASFLLPQAGIEDRLYGLETTVTGPGVFTLRLKSSTSYASSGWDIMMDGFVKQSLRSYWDGFNYLEKMSIPSGTHTLRLSAPPGASAGQTAAPAMMLVQEASWQQEQAVSLNEALDGPALTFTTGGVASWEGVSTGTTDFARVSQAATPGTAWLEMPVAGQGLLRFSPSLRGLAAAAMQLMIDGVSQSVILDQENFVEVKSVGAQTLRWSVALGSIASQQATLDAVSYISYNTQAFSSWTAGAGFSLTPSNNDWITVSEPDMDGGGSIHPMNYTPSAPPWVEGQFTGPAALEFSLFNTGSAPFIISVDGVRVVYTENPSSKAVWKSYRRLLPAGQHTVRWTWPAISGQPAIGFLDGLKLTPSTVTLMDAAELPAGSRVTSDGRGWLPLQDGALPDGDALELESGASVIVPLTGPGTVTFHIKNAHPYASEVYLEHPSVDWRGQWTDEADGWSLVSLDLLPGDNTLTIRPYGFLSGYGPLLLDRMTITPSQVAGLAEIYPIPNATFTTNPANPIQGYSPGTAAYATSIRGGPEAWFELNVTGPGIVHCGTSTRDGGFTILVDGHLFNALQVDWVSQPRYDAPSRYALVLPAGNHTVRWTLILYPPETYQPRPAAFGKISSLTFTPALHGFTFPAGEMPALLSSDDPPVTLTEEGGVPVLHIPKQQNTGANLVWTTPSPGVLSFKTRRLPGVPALTGLDYPATIGSMYINAGRPQYYWAPEIYLSDTADWREVTRMVPIANSQIIWNLPQAEISDFKFTPYENVPLIAAMGLPGVSVSTSSPHTWEAMRDANGHSIIVPGQAETWMEATITGPVELTWRETLTNREHFGFWGENIETYDWSLGYTSPDVRVNRINVSSAQEMQVTSQIWYSAQIPSGPHTLRWLTRRRSLASALTVLDQFETHPISAAYLAWRPLYPGTTYSPPLPPTGDYDHDGQTNLMEFTYGTDPITANRSMPTVLAKEGDHFTVCVPVPRPVSDGIKVTLQTSPDMATWTDAAVTPLTPAPSGQEKYRLNGIAPTARWLFVRTRVELIGP
jgi:hypothetical protein